MTKFCIEQTNLKSDRRFVQIGLLPLFGCLSNRSVITSVPSTEARFFDTHAEAQIYADYLSRFKKVGKKHFTIHEAEVTVKLLVASKMNASNCEMPAKVSNSAMDIESITGRVHRLISEQLGINLNEISSSCRFSDLGADSLDDVEIIMGLEDEFDIEITDVAAEECTKVSDAIALVESLLKERALCLNHRR